MSVAAETLAWVVAAATAPASVSSTVPPLATNHDYDEGG